MTPSAAPRLCRESAPATTPRPAPVRIVHLGLGAFHRAHQAWYTSRASDAGEWGIAAFTGRSSTLARDLAAQDGLFTLIERGPHGDRFEIVSSIVRAVPGADTDSFTDHLADPAVAILTLTITEAGYHLDRDGLLDLSDPQIVEDVERMRLALASPVSLRCIAAATALGRVLVGLEARLRAGGPPLAIVPCDNIPDNGRVVRRALETLAAAVSADLARWLADSVSFVATSVDRITPRALPADRDDALAATGRRDAAPVVTEPFADWILSGRFPSGRPDWESAGARVVDDIAPWQRRKLWMLNGAHTLIAAFGTLRGHRVVSTAIADPVIRGAVEDLWDEAARHNRAVESADYRRALVERFANPRIEHWLDQIGTDAATKLGLRIAPIARADRSAGGRAEGCARAFAAWALAVDAGLQPAPEGASAADGLRRLIGGVDRVLGEDDDFCADVEHLAGVIARDLTGTSRDRRPNEPRRAGTQREDSR